MGMFRKIRRLFARSSSASGETPAAPGGRGGALAALSLYGGGSAAPTAALQSAAVYRCVKVVSESVANLRVRCLVRRAGGIFADDAETQLPYLLQVQPDPAFSAYDFWAQAVQQILLEGNAYVIPFRSPSGEVNRLALCAPHTVSHDTAADTYTVSDFQNGIYGTFAEKDVLHFKNLSVYGKRGVSVLAWARLTLGISAAADNETLNRFANGGTVRGLVSNDTSVRGFGEYQDSELQKAAADIDSRFSSGERIVSLPGQVEFKQISLSSTDMQFLESRKFTVREVCRFFGVHPSFVFDDTSNNYKSAEMANVAFLSHTLDPLLKRIENELQRKLVPAAQCGLRRFQFDRRGLYACDLDSRVKYQAQTIACGLYTVNEWRAAENKPPVAGGDRVLVSSSLKEMGN